MTLLRRACFLLLLLAGSHTNSPLARGDEPKAPALATRNVVVVTADGLRWQEVFRGAEESLLNKKDGGVARVDELRREFWRDNAEARREALMPFLWTVVARQGQIYGNNDKKSPARVTNGKNFSYPGYNELFTGSADDRIDSNNKVPNPNVNVFEWLNKLPAYQGKVTVIGSWDVYPFIFNRERSGLYINAGWVPIERKNLSEGELVLNRMMAQTPQTWEGCRNDAFTFQVALEHLKHESPSVMYIGLGDTDEHAHEGHYDHYLHAAHDADGNLKILWDELQANPKYKGTTTVIFTTDHGRGDPPQGWRSHGAKIDGSEAIWLAVLGPDTPALGERSDAALITQSQVAGTVAALLGEDFRAEAPKSAPPLVEAIRPGSR